MRRRDLIARAAALAAGARLSKVFGPTSPVHAAILPGGNRLPPGFYNFNGANLVRWHAALSAQQQGYANAAIGCLGDSTVAGQGAAGDELRSNAKSLSWPTQLAKSIPGGSWSSVWGDNNIGAAAADLHDFDARLDRPGWGINSIEAAGGICGGLFHGQPSTGTRSFAPTNQIDTIDVWYVQSPGNGFFSIGVDGGAPLKTVDCSGANAFRRATASCASGFHAINLRGTASGRGDVYLSAVRAYDSAIKEVSVYNLGGCRWGSADFIVSQKPWNTLPALVAIAPNLVIFQAGIINDWDDLIPLPTVTSNMMAVIDAMKSVNCDVILMSGAPSKAGVFASYETQARYVANMKSTAYEADVPFIDVWGLFGGSWKQSAMFDSLHPNGTGYALIAGYARAALIDPLARSAS